MLLPALILSLMLSQVPCAQCTSLPYAPGQDDAANLAKAKAIDRKASQARAERKKACGADWGRLEVGMPWETVQRCAGPTRFELVGQMADMSTYRTPGGTVIVVRESKVASWVAGHGY